MAWSDLPRDIVGLVHNRLHYVDQVRLGAVCKNWRRITKEFAAAGLGSIYYLPWLITHTPNRPVNLYHEELFDPHSQQVMRSNTSTLENIFPEQPGGRIVHASKGGWLLLGYSDSNLPLFLYNPFTRHVLNLPKLPRVSTRNTSIAAATFSMIDDDPSSPHEVEVFVMLKDACNAFQDDVCSMHLMGGQLYCLFKTGTSLIITVTDVDVLGSDQETTYIICDPGVNKAWLGDDSEGNLLLLVCMRHDNYMVYKINPATMKRSDFDVNMSRAFFVSGKVLISAKLPLIDVDDHDSTQGSILFYNGTDNESHSVIKCFSLKKRDEILLSPTAGYYGFYRSPQSFSSITFIEPPYII